MSTPIAPRIVVAVTGSLDAAALPRWRQRLEDAVTADPAHLVVDLTGCTGVDQAGTALLATVHERLWATGGRLTLRGMNPRLDQVPPPAPAPSGYRPRHRRQWQRAQQPTGQRQSDEVRWWPAPTTDGAR